jgi:hypothetical protein
MPEMTAQEMYETMLRLWADPAFRESGRRLDAAMRVAMEHDEQWRKEHPNRWIAADCNGLIAVADSHAELIGKVRELGIPLDEVYEELLREPRPVIVL